MALPLYLRFFPEEGPSITGLHALWLLFLASRHLASQVDALKSTRGHDAIMIPHRSW
jgi:hypothetical protein